MLGGCHGPCQPPLGSATGSNYKTNKNKSFIFAANRSFDFGIQSLEGFELLSILFLEKLEFWRIYL
jgi:hypothetical protein